MEKALSMIKADTLFTESTTSFDTANRLKNLENDRQLGSV